MKSGETGAIDVIGGEGGGESMDKRMTSGFDESIRFFGRYTWKDLLRLAVPTAVLVRRFNLSELSLALTIGLFLLGGSIGVAWYSWRPYGHPVDHHLFHLGRWITLRVI